MPRSRPAWSARRTGVISMAAAGVIALTMSGCTGAPEPTPTPSATTDAAEPIFASDEEALAAAEEAYAGFTEISGQLSADPEADDSLIAERATPNYVPEFQKSLEDFHSSGLVTTGSVALSDFILAQQMTNADKIADVQIYVCTDSSEYRILNSEGTDVTPPARQERATMLVRLLGDSPGSRNLLVDSTELWADSAAC